jgi:hypothetical protein
MVLFGLKKVSSVVSGCRDDKIPEQVLALRDLVREKGSACLCALARPGAETGREAARHRSRKRC